jgi:hypothetical protein
MSSERRTGFEPTFYGSATQPKLNFPSEFLAGAVTASYPGMVVNGRSFEVNSRAEKLR